MRAPTTLSPSRTASRTRFLAAPALALTLVLGAAACSGSGAGSEDSGSSQGQADSSSGGVSGDAAGASAEGTDRAVVSTATLGVRVSDLAAASAAVQGLATGAGGLVTASQAGGAGDEQQAHFTLRVPSASFDAVLEGVAGLGRQTDRSTTSADVTAEVADVDSRVASAQAVLVTFRDRLPQASTIPDVLAIEGEIARRQADLEALQARQRVLADQVALATVDVTLTQGGPTSVVPASSPGFTGGLGAGWRALGEFVRIVTLVAGVVLPFAVPVALVAVPVLLLRRRRAASGNP
jgi:hypothetical protein